MQNILSITGCFLVLLTAFCDSYLPATEGITMHKRREKQAQERVTPSKGPYKRKLRARARLRENKKGQTKDPFHAYSLQDERFDHREYELSGRRKRPAKAPVLQDRFTGDMDQYGRKLRPDTQEQDVAVDLREEESEDTAFADDDDDYIDESDQE